MAIWRPSFLQSCLSGCGAGRWGEKGEGGREDDDWKRRVATLVEASSGYEKEKVEDIIVVAIGKSQ